MAVAGMPFLIFREDFAGSFRRPARSKFGGNPCLPLNSLCNARGTVTLDAVVSKQLGTALLRLSNLQICRDMPPLYVANKEPLEWTMAEDDNDSPAKCLMKTDHDFGILNIYCGDAQFLLVDYHARRQHRRGTSLGVLANLTSLTLARQLQSARGSAVSYPVTPAAKQCFRGIQTRLAALHQVQAECGNHALMIKG